MKRKSRMLCVSTKKFYVDNVNKWKKIVHTHTLHVCVYMVESPNNNVCVRSFLLLFLFRKMIKRCVSPAKVFGDVKCMSRIVRLLSDVVSRRSRVSSSSFCLCVYVSACVCMCACSWMCVVSTVRCCACETNIVRSISAPILPMCVSVWFLCLSFSLSLLLLLLGFSSVSVGAAAAAVALFIAASVGRPFGRLSVFFSLSVFLLLHRHSLSRSYRAHLWWFALVHVCVCVLLCSALLPTNVWAMCVFGSLAIMLTFIAIIVIVISIYLALCIVFVPKI